ncbi:hypothetical protein IHE45_09G042500 [Dioscorea alata]|uniref:Uncharacterized protein n=1 Tax=Dioscorea alata TaxID=55571 RepID=A0ACB7VEQ5_DIOAL|nr:hypothetical protein IHE45_09G042500 [Dioscorea alata]
MKIPKKKKRSRRKTRSGSSSEAENGGLEIIVRRREKVEIEAERKRLAERRRGSGVTIVDDGRGGAAVAVTVISGGISRGSAREKRGRWPEKRGGATRTAEGLNGAAEGAGGGAGRWRGRGELGVREGRRRRGGDGGRRRGEVGASFRAAKSACSGVVGTGGILGGVEGAEPNPCLLPWVSDLRRETAPWSLPHASVPRLLQLRSHLRRRRCCRCCRRRRYGPRLAHRSRAIGIRGRRSEIEKGGDEVKRQECPCYLKKMENKNEE